MLPDPHEDELFYSVLARHADHMGLHDTSAFNQLVFGTARLRPTIEIPPRLDLLLPRLLPGSPFTGPSVIANNSLVPYFTTFMSEAAIAEATERVMRADMVPASSQLGVTTITGALRLRLCEECVDADQRARREPYWRRAHQLPGCVVCHAHGSPLRDGPSVRSSESAGFVSVSRALDAGDVLDLRRIDHLGLATTVAIISNAFLNRAVRSDGEERLALVYELIRERGWRHGARLAARNLVDHAVETYGPDILAIVDVHQDTYRPAGGGGAGKSTDWLATCLRVRSRIKHPLPYILLMAIAGVDAAALLDGRAAAAGRAGPVTRDGPCGNVVCSMYDPPVPRRLPSTGQGLVHVACPTCGFAYRQSADCTIPKNRRITTYGHVLDDAIRRECEVGDGTRPQLEQRLGLSIETIKARAQVLGVWHPRWGKQTEAHIKKKRQGQWTARRQRSAQRYRRKWLGLAQRHPGLGRVALGRHDPTTYSFLRTYDREWLDQVTPKVIRAPAPTPSSADADEHLAAAIDAAADALFAADPPVRVTKQAIARSMGKGVIRLNSTRMPRSAAALDERAESLAAFNARLAGKGTAQNGLETTGRVKVERGGENG